MASTSGQFKDRRNSKYGYGPDKFPATQLWKDVVDEFRSRMESELNVANGSSARSTPIPADQRRFNGLVAVEILTNVLKENQERFGMEVTREKAVKLCQFFLSDNTIAPVPGTKNQKHFSATKNAYYYFIESDSVSLTSTNEDEKIRLRQTVTPESCARMASNRSWTNLAGSAEDLTDLDDKIVRDFALSHLLTLVDIPILEGILQMRSDDDGSMFKTLENLFSKISLHRNGHQSPRVSIVDEPMQQDLDELTTAGYRCLQACCGGVIFQTIPSAMELQRHVIDGYQKVVSKHGSLIPSQYASILGQISGMIEKGTNEEIVKSLEACQCLCLLLPKEIREQLGALLHFLRLIIDTDDESSLQNKAANIKFLTKLETVSKFVFPKELYCTVISTRLMEFILEHGQDVLACPKDFRRQVYTRQLLLEHTGSEPKPEMTFCKRISTHEFKRQALTETERGLFEVLHNVVENETNKEKQREYLKRFRKEYPKIYDRYYE